jgi:hypothetical protein
MNNEEFEFDTTAREELDPIDIFGEARNSIGLYIESTFSSATKRRTAYIRTSDRITYRRCRRKWNWADSKRRNLQSNQAASPLWLGSGLHYCFEDFHGPRNHEHPRDALQAYYDATLNSGLQIPSDAEDLLVLGKGMMDYYEGWLEHRDPLTTFVVDGEPQVEVQIFIEIPKEHLIPYCPDPSILDEYDQILYSLTIDRVIIDELGRLWVVEYKSAKNFQWMHLETDQQVTSYTWGTGIKYPGYQIAGTIYQQHKKQILQPPAFLASTKLFSTSKRQKTSRAMYINALRNLYGNDERVWPAENRLFLQFLDTQESHTADHLIRRDYVERNENQVASEYQKILMEIPEMLNPNTPIYPNPTRDCSWDCPFQTPCIGIDSGEDYEHELEVTTMRRDAPETFWRNHLLLPQLVS